MLSTYQGTVGITNAPSLPSVGILSKQSSVSVETIETLLGRISLPSQGTPLSAHQIRRLTSITCSNGTPLLTLHRRAFVYEVLGGCAINGFDEFVGFVEETAKLGPISTSDLLFDSSLFTREKNTYLADMDRSRRNISVMVGVVECIKCHSMNTASVEVQLRSADEASNVVSNCFACGKRWKT